MPEAESQVLDYRCLIRTVGLEEWAGSGKKKKTVTLICSVKLLESPSSLVKKSMMLTNCAGSPLMVEGLDCTWKRSKKITNYTIKVVKTIFFLNVYL